jgi:hypothetical protein
MRPGTERVAPVGLAAGPEGADPLTCADGAEGAAYARAWLDRVAAGLGDPAELVALVGFLQTGPMLHGACVVIFDALRCLAQQGGTP